MVTCAYFIFLEIFQKSVISKNAVSERWRSDSSRFNFDHENIFTLLVEQICNS